MNPLQNPAIPHGIICNFCQLLRVIMPDSFWCHVQSMSRCVPCAIQLALLIWYGRGTPIMRSQKQTPFAPWAGGEACHQGSAGKVLQSIFGPRGTMSWGVWDMQWGAGEEHLGMLQVLPWDVKQRNHMVGKGRDQGSLGRSKHGKVEV